MNRRLIIPLVAVAIGLIFYGFNRYRLSTLPYEWSGTVEAHTMDVGSRVGGRVEQVLVHEGDDVTAGQSLIILEPGDLPAQRLQAQGSLMQAEAALERVASQSLPTARRAEIAAAQARLEAEKIGLEKATNDRDRMTKLFAAEAATRADQDNADIAFRNASAQVAALQASLDQLLHGTPQDVKSAQGQLDAAKGKLQQIDSLIAELTIRAPLPSRVEALDLRPGDILMANATAAKLLEPRELYVRIYVPETQLGQVHAKQEVPIFVDSYAGRAFKGVVEFVSDVGEFTPRNLQTFDERADQVFAARVRVSDGAEALRVGMAAVVRVSR